jgi:hypothetical protein
MKKIFLFIIIIPTFIFSQKANDSLLTITHQKQIESLNKKIDILEGKYEYQVKINEQTLNSISNQIGATSYNLSIFAFLFGILAICLGVYVTWVERKIIRIREDNESLLKETIKTKEEVIEINELIQKDIYGLFLKIKREETVHILNRLVKIPEDITNLSEQLLSRELQEQDFSFLKKAYLKLKVNIEKHDNPNNYEIADKNKYQLLFFQHFLDLTIKDEEIGPDLISYYYYAVDCSFKNDILKSTEDFMKAIIDLGFQTKSEEINSYINAISRSEFKDSKKVFKVIFDSLKTKNDRFKFYEVINNEEENKIGKINFGIILIDKYGNSELTESEKGILKEIRENILQLEKEKENTSN